ncbi:MAG TPA: amidase [Nannocystaceae bacterium]|nr:amidase [Nannocystaceae bacterium]
MTELLDVSAMALARWIREKRVSPREVVEAHIDRIVAVNPALNAVIAQRFDQARAEAREAEALVMRTSDPATLPPLLGLPYTTKEYIQAKGMPLSAGIWSRRHVKADDDAETVRRLGRAGAILVGITNVPEGGLWLETYNDVYGRTVNPWDRSRSAGGSSGGEGAIVAAGGVAFGLGADVGGSIRIPAAFCGTVGHKPSGRLVPNTGFWPQARGELSAYLVCGPLTRKVEDVMPILRVLAGPDGVDEVVRPFELDDPARVDLRDVVVYPAETNGSTRVSAANRQAVHDAAAALRERGATLRELDAAKMKRAVMIWSAMMATSGGPSYAEVLGNGTAISPGRELLRLALGRSHHTLPALVIVGLEQLAARMPGQVEKAVAQGKALQAELEELLGKNGVMLHPPYSSPAPRHYRPMLRPFDFVCTGLFNVLEFPSTVVPLGFDGDGLPLSVQVIGRRGADGLTIAVAGALESDFGGWKRASPTWRVQETRARDHLSAP